MTVGPGSRGSDPHKPLAASGFVASSTTARPGLRPGGRRSRGFSYRAALVAIRPELLDQYDGLFDETFFDDAGLVAQNSIRRHLTLEQRALAAVKLARMKWGGDRARGPETSCSREDAAEKMGVSPASVKRASAIQEAGVSELQEAVGAHDNNNPGEHDR